MNAIPALLDSINTSRGGVPKQPLFEALVTERGIDGDKQRNRRFHGGPDRAVVLYSTDVIRELQREGHPIAVGSVGENLTLCGVEWTTMTPGIRLKIGEVQLTITKHTSPCEKISRFFTRGDFTRISQKLHPGWSRLSARVERGGLIRVGDPVLILHQSGDGR